MANIISRDGMIGMWTSIVITFCGLVLVLIATLYPYDFHFKEMDISLWYNFLILGWGKLHIEDVIKIVMLFVLLGFGLTCLMQERRPIRLIVLSVILLLSFGLSYTIENFQYFLSECIRIYYLVYGRMIKICVLSQYSLKSSKSATHNSRLLTSNSQPYPNFQ